MTFDELEAHYSALPGMVNARQLAALCQFSDTWESSEKWFSKNKARLIAEHGFPAPVARPGVRQRWWKFEVWDWLMGSGRAYLASAGAAAEDEADPGLAAALDARVREAV
jgi:hypothetical protein